METINLDEFEEELKINNASLFSLERELLSHPKKTAKYFRWLAESVREVDRLTLNLEIVVAEILDEFDKEAERNKKPLSAYALDSLRKSKVPLDKRYQKVKKRLAEAKETAAILEGFVEAWRGRGFRLRELVQLSSDIMLPEPRIYQGKGGEAIKFGEEDFETKLGRASKILQE